MFTASSLVYCRLRRAGIRRHPEYDRVMPTEYPIERRRIIDLHDGLTPGR